MIPKKINYCWFGRNKKPKEIEECINSWKVMCPDYEIIEWNEDNFDVNINNYVSQAYDCKKWAFVSDYARLWVVYNYGGIYLDTDVKLIKNLDEILQYDLFLCSEDNNRINTGIGFGAEKGNLIIKKMLDDYKNINFLNNGKMDLTPCPIRNTDSITEFMNNIADKTKMCIIGNSVYYSKEYFNPKNELTNKYDVTDNTYGIHLYLASWVKPHKKVIFKIKQKIKLFLVFLGKGCRRN